MGDIDNVTTFHPGTGVGSLLNRAHSALMDALLKELEPLDITGAQYVVVMTLADGAVESTSQICRNISYDPGAMTRMIDRLEQKRFVRRVPNPDDRRATRLELTPEGRAIYPKLREHAVAVLNRLLRGFTKAQARQFEDFLRRILHNA